MLTLTSPIHDESLCNTRQKFMRGGEDSTLFRENNNMSSAVNRPELLITDDMRSDQNKDITMEDPYSALVEGAASNLTLLPKIVNNAHI